MYDEKGRMIKMSTTEGERNLYKQQGIYERLLCINCENFINDFEKHVKKVFYDKMDYLETENKEVIKIVDLDYNKFKLFQLSLLWRASVSKNPFFINVALGPHEEIIRNMILNKNPGKIHEYGCIILGLTTKELGLFDAIITPEKGRIENHIAYRFILGSSLWFYLVSKQSHRFERKKYFLQQDGTLLYNKFTAKDIPFIRKMVTDFKNAGKLS